MALVLAQLQRSADRQQQSALVLPHAYDRTRIHRRKTESAMAPTKGRISSLLTEVPEIPCQIVIAKHRSTLPRERIRCVIGIKLGALLPRESTVRKNDPREL
jgi:hypothetical protein